MKKRALAVLILLAVLLIGVYLFSAGKEASPPVNLFTDEDILRFMSKSDDFSKSHSQMAVQRDRLTAILNDFLTGDTDSLKENSDLFIDDMSKVEIKKFETKEKESVVWQAMAEILNEAKRAQVQISNDRYDRAYLHYTNIGTQCIRCHQAIRESGTFPEPKPVQ